MRLIVAAIGRLKDGPERDLAGRYADRARALAPKIGLAGPDILELPVSRDRSDAARRADEGRRLAEKLGDAPMVVLDERSAQHDQRGAALDSVAFARSIALRRDAGGRHLAFVIGGADGLSDPLRARAAWTVGFGAMTLPHQLVRVVLLEQIYRAMTILSDHPYHRVGGSEPT